MDNMREAPSMMLALRLLARGSGCRGGGPAASASDVVSDLDQVATPLEAHAGAAEASSRRAGRSS
jgi:hypothetical protein